MMLMGCKWVLGIRKLGGNLNSGDLSGRLESILEMIKLVENMNGIYKFIQTKCHECLWLYT